MEVWKPVKDFEGLYEVSNYGNVRSVDRTIMRKNGNPLNLKGKILPQYKFWGKSTIPRYRVNLSKESKCYSKFVHRLVAMAFIPNPNDLPQVNHKDEDPSNNHVDNLEWCDEKYNHNYGTRNERHKEKLKKPVDVFTLSNEYVCSYNSIKEASEALNLDASGITKVCKQKNKYCGKYIFKYAS